MRYWLAILLLCATAATAAEDEMHITNLHKAITSHKVWLNTSRALEPEDLQGRIILLDFWTLGCINCMHVIPDLKYLEHEFGDKLTVIGVHSAKFADERDTESIRDAILRYGLVHPVVNDSDFAIWKKFGVNAWPTLVLIGPMGTIASAYAGEGNRAALEADIKKLLETYKGRINTSPLPMQLESSKQPQTVLSFPGKIITLDGKKLAIADSAHNRIIITDLQGAIQQTIGSGKEGLKDGSFSDAQFFRPHGMAYKDGLLYIADTNNNALRLADLNKQTVTTLAGDGSQGSVRTPHASAAKSTALSSPWDVAFYPNKNYLTIAMAGTHQLWIYDIAQQTISLLAGSGEESIEDGTLPTNSLSQPSGLSPLGDKLYFADAETSSLRVLDKGGDITTLIGSGLFDFGYKEGARDTALMQHCLALIADGNDIYITDTYNHSIRHYDIKAGTLTNYAGRNLRGNVDGPRAEATFNEPGGITKLGDILYVADTNNNAIRTIDIKTGTVATLPVGKAATPAAPTASESVPNLQTLSLSVAADTLIEVKLGLKEGWHINKDAPSELSLFSDIALKNPIANFSKETLKTGLIMLPKLAASTSYHLKGTLYYCTDAAGALCMIKSFDVSLSPKGKDTKAILPIN